MKERLQKIIASRGVASRRQAESMIAEGRVTCNGRVCQLGDSADVQIDTILVDGKPLPSEEKRVYIMLNKPRGFVTTMSDEKGRRDVTQLVRDCRHRVYPVGRLDMDSEGLLLMTNDGDFAYKMMHPRHQINKVYCVLVSGYTDAAAERLARPIVLDGYKISPPDVSVQWVDDDRAMIQVTIHEGRNRQVRRMCAEAGMKVIRLRRTGEGSLCLGDLPTGKWRYLTCEEVESLL